VLDRDRRRGQNAATDHGLVGWNGGMRLHPRAPSLDVQRRRRSGGGVVPASVWVVLAVLAACGWLWRVVGSDLARGAHLNAAHDAGERPGSTVKWVQRSGGLPAAGQATVPDRATVAGGPAGVRAPAHVSAAPIKSTSDLVAASLLAGAKDQLARKVAATFGNVEDLRAASGSPFDLVERGLADHLPLRTALARHLQREVKPARAAARKLAPVEQLFGFLQTYARSAPADSLAAGDIVYLQRRASSMAWPAIVSDTLDGDGAPLVITLDPADRVAREQPMARYRFRQGFRLAQAELARIRTVLGLSDLQAASARVL
jgi:hypothetical protein